MTSDGGQLRTDTARSAEEESAGRSRADDAMDTDDRARVSVQLARDVENAVRTESARLRSAGGTDDGAADAAAMWIDNLPDTLRAGPAAWREWTGVRLRDLGVKGRNAAQSAMQFCLDRGVHLAGWRCFRACGVRQDTEAQVWEDSIVEASNGWAQHLRHYLAFAVRAALAGDGACHRDDLADMLEAGDAERIAYYKKRIGALGTHEGCAWEIAAHLESRGGVSRRTALAAIVSADLRAQGVSEITKEAVDQCLTAAVHAGLLDNDGGAWRIPIPSFQAHLCHEPPPDRRAEVAGLPSPAG